MKKFRFYPKRHIVYTKPFYRLLSCYNVNKEFKYRNKLKWVSNGWGFDAEGYEYLAFFAILFIRW